MVELDPARRYGIGQLTDGLPDPPGQPPLAAAPGRRTARTELDRRLLAIPATEYVLALSGREPDRAGKIHCPFHEDHDPSLQLYDDGTWYCFGACRAGGSVFDFAARVYGTSTKDHAFLLLRGRLADELLATAARS